MKTRRSTFLHRRRFLQSLGFGAVGAPLMAYLPWLEAEAEAQPRPAPLRILFFLHANGVYHADWKPSGGPTSLTLQGQALSTLERHKARLTVVTGTSQVTANDGQGANHRRLSIQALTATPLAGSGSTAAGGPSIDQVIAKQVGATTPFKTLQLGAGQAHVFSFTGANAPVAPFDSPVQALNTVFGGGSASPTPAPSGDAGPSSRLVQRQKVFDFVRPQLQAVAKRLGTADRQRIEAHVQAVSDLEKQLADLDSRVTAPATGGGTITKPTIAIPTRGSWESWDAYAPAFDPNIKIAAAALAADLTRVVVFCNGNSGCTGLNVGFSGAGVDWHDQAHPHAAALAKVEAWHGQKFAMLLDELAKIPEGNGTVLDNTIAVWTSSMGDGNHTPGNMPVVLAGGGGGKLKGGRLVSASGKTTGQLFTTLAQAMGVNIPSFGSSKHGTGAIQGIFG